MFRHRVRIEVMYGHMGEFLEIAEEARDLADKRGWAAPTCWWPLVGRGDVIVEETDYPTLQPFEQQTTAMLADPEYMKLLRRRADIAVQGSVHDELLEPTIKIS